MMLDVNTSTILYSESWFITIDIFIVVCLSCSTLLAVGFLLIVLLNKTCQTASIIHSCNTCVAIIINGLNLIWADLFRLNNDLKRRIYQDTFCAFRGYLGYVGVALLLYSFTFKAIYRYMIVVYPTNLIWKSIRFQWKLISICWIICMSLFLPWLITGDMIYQVDYQACLLLFRLSTPMIYNIILVYLLPLSSIVFIYFKLVQCIRHMSRQSIASVRRLFRVQRELSVIRRILIMICILIVLGLPYTIFALLSFIIEPPRYHYRFSIIFIDMTQLLIMFILFKFTRPISTILFKFQRIHICTIHPIQ